MSDTKNAKLEAYEELLNRQKAEKDAIEAIKRVSRQLKELNYIYAQKDVSSQLLKSEDKSLRS